MKISPVVWMAAVTLTLLPGCKVAEVLIGPPLPPSQSKLKKQAEAEAAMAPITPGDGWSTGPGPYTSPAPISATNPAGAPVAPQPEAPAAPRENPHTNSQLYNPEIPKNISITWGPKDDKTGAQDAIDSRLRQIEEIVKQSLTAKGYNVLAAGQGGAQDAKVEINYESEPAMTAGDSGWDHEVKLSLSQGSDSLGSVSCRWSNLESTSIDSVIRPLTVRAATKIPGPKGP